MFSRSPSRTPLSAVLVVGVALSFAFAAALVASVMSAAPSSAHAVLIKVTPAANAQLTRTPRLVVLEFDEPVIATFATVVVTNAAGASVAQGNAAVQGAKVTEVLSPDMASGRYRVAFQVTSNDGHPVSGESRFTLTLPSGTRPATSAGASSAKPSVPVTATPPAQGSNAVQGSWLTRFLVPIAGTVGLIVVGGGTALRKRKRR
jgi:copper resistance protein C